jgi:hypothetical protein
LSFVNERNSGVVRELRELLEENGQEVPHWLNQMSSYGGRGGSGGGGGRGRELVCQLLPVVSYFSLLFVRIVLLNTFASSLILCYDVEYRWSSFWRWKQLRKSRLQAAEE